jgi:Ca2+-binding RTX toxin-like protein
MRRHPSLLSRPIRHLQPRARCRPAVERLEERRLLAVTATIIGKTLTVTGDNNNNFIDLHVNPGDNSKLDVFDQIRGPGVNPIGTFAYTGFTMIYVDTKDGDDTVFFDTDGVITNSVHMSQPATVVGGTGNDQFYGDAGEETCYAGVGFDTLQGGRGDDTYVFPPAPFGAPLQLDYVNEEPGPAPEGADTIDFHMLPANDPVTVDIGPAGINPQPIVLPAGVAAGSILLAQATNRQVYAAAPNFRPDGLENIVGGAGDDTLLGNAKANRITGNAGDNEMDGRGSGDTFIYNPNEFPGNSDTITEPIGATNNTLDCTAMTIGANVDLTNDNKLLADGIRMVMTSAAGVAATFQTVLGGSGDDTVLGNAADNLLIGNGGADSITGGSGMDVLYGDTTNSGSTLGANDTLTAGSGDSTLIGGPGDDTLLGGGGKNVLYGDTTDVLSAINGNDSITAGSGPTTLIGGPGSDALVGGAGADAYIFDGNVATGGETDVVSAQPNTGVKTIDWSYFANVDRPVYIDLASDAFFGLYTDPHGNMRTIRTAAAGEAQNFDNVIGGPLGDTLMGNSADNLIEGLLGDDSLVAGSGGGTLQGGAGNDTLVAGPGDASLVGGTGNDTYEFEPSLNPSTTTVDEQPNQGTDTLDFSALAAGDGVTVDLTNDDAVASYTNRAVVAPAGGAANLENVVGGDGDDFITGNAAANLLAGGNGADTFAAGAGNDTMDGGAGSDNYLFEQGHAPFGSHTVIEAPGCVDDDIITLDLVTPSTIDIGSTRPQLVNAADNLTLTLSSATGIEDVQSSNPADTITLNGCMSTLAPGATVGTGGPILNSNQVLIAQTNPGPPSNRNPIAGAVNQVVQSAVDPSTYFAATVNGGVWRTTDIGATWTPLTDRMPSLAIGAIAFDPLDAKEQTLFAATGQFSSGYTTYTGPAVGIYRSIDDGDTWTQLAAGAPGAAGAAGGLMGINVRVILPTRVMAPGQVLLAATTTGLYRSTNGGMSFARIMVGVAGAATPVTDLLGDPTDATSMRYYAALRGFGVFRSTDAGLTWQRINGSAPMLLGGAGASTNLKLAINPSGDLFAAVAGPSGGQQVLTGVFRTTNAATGVPEAMPLPGGSVRVQWSALGVAPNVGSGADSRLSIAADPAPANRQIAYVGGVLVTPAPFVGNLYIFNPGPSTWSTIVKLGAGPAPGTGPHADTRSMSFDSFGDLVQADDGGIYYLSSPSTAARRWKSLEGNLVPTEYYSLAYDPVGKVEFGGAQDVGMPQQYAPGSTTWFDDSNFTGDGDQVDVGTNAAGTQSTRYFFSNNIRSFYRAVFTNANPPAQVGATVRVGEIGLVGGDATITAAVATALGVNKFNPLSVAIGYNTLYQSIDGGENLTVLVAAGGGNHFTSIVYGGRQGRDQRPEVLYAGTDAGQLFVRRAGAAAAAPPAAVVAAGYDGTAIREVAVDPGDWQHVFLVSNANQVFESIDAGARFINITATGGVDLRMLLQNRVQTISIVNLNPARGDEGDAILAGGFGGVYIRSLKSAVRAPNMAGMATWTRLDNTLPTVMVTDVRYYPGDDVVSVGTFGRGAFLIKRIRDLLVPSVADLAVNNNSWNANFRTFLNFNKPGTGDFSIPVGTGFKQLRPLPFVGLDRITIYFTKPVTVTQAALRLTGQAKPNYTFSGFAYNANTLSATWIVTQPIDNDRLTLTLDATGANAVRSSENGGVLDGDWRQPMAYNGNATSLFSSGDGMPGGDFVFRFNILAGDVVGLTPPGGTPIGNGFVTTADVTYVRGKTGAVVGGANYDPYADVDGNGGINGADVNLVNQRVGNRLPGGGGVRAPFGSHELAFAPGAGTSVGPAHDSSAPRRAPLPGAPIAAGPGLVPAGPAPPIAVAHPRSARIGTRHAAYVIDPLRPRIITARVDAPVYMSPGPNVDFIPVGPAPALRKRAKSTSEVLS